MRFIGGLIFSALVSLSSYANESSYDQGIRIATQKTKAYMNYFGHQYDAATTRDLVEQFQSIILTAKNATQSSLTQETLSNLSNYLNSAAMATTYGTKQYQALSGGSLARICERVSEDLKRARQYDLTTPEQLFMSKLSGLGLDRKKHIESLLEELVNTRQSLELEKAQLEKQIEELRPELKRLQDIGKLPEKIETIEAELQKRKLQLTEITVNMVAANNELLEARKQKGNYASQLQELKNTVEKIIVANTSGVYNVAETTNLEAIQTGDTPSSTKLQQQLKSYLAEHLNYWLETTIMDRKPEWETSAFRIDITSRILSFAQIPKANPFSRKGYVVQVALQGMVTDPFHKKARSTLATFTIKGGRIEPEQASHLAINDLFDRIRDSAEELHVQSELTSPDKQLLKMVRDGVSLEEVRARLQRFSAPDRFALPPASPQAICEGHLLTDGQADAAEIARATKAQPDKVK